LRQDRLVTVFENGELLVDYTLDQIRAAAAVTDTSPTTDTYPEGAWAAKETWNAWAKINLRCDG